VHASVANNSTDMDTIYTRTDGHVRTLNDTAHSLSSYTTGNDIKPLVRFMHAC